MRKIRRKVLRFGWRGSEGKRRGGWKDKWKEGRRKDDVGERERRRRMIIGGEGRERK